MRIAIDGTLITNRPKGVARYLTNLLTQLADIDQVNEYQVYYDRRVRAAFLPRPERFSYREVDFRGNLHWKLFGFQKILARERVDLVHLPSESRAVTTSCPCVVTVHEIAQTRWQLEKRVSPYEFLCHRLNEWQFRRNIHKVDAIIAVSQATKDDLMRLYPVDNAKVTVIHEAPDPRLLSGLARDHANEVLSKLGAPHGFVLCFATGDSRENVEAVLVAYRLVQDLVPHKFVFCGVRDSTENHLKQRCLELGIMDRVSILGFVDDSMLSDLYAAADLYVDISYYEGFGLQACEAIACGVPVIASHIPAFVEVLGEAAEFVGVDDSRALALAIQKLLTNRDEWHRRSHLGCERARAFSWHAAAKQTLTVYESAVKYAR